MSASASEVFALLHDYDRRLEWDTLLKEARLTRGSVIAEKGATSLCVGKPMFGIVGVETRYIAFKEGEMAAVELINKPPFFAEFAASIRHEDNADGSVATYKYKFAAKPRLLRRILEPIMQRRLRKETEDRLDALASFFAKDFSNTP